MWKWLTECRGVRDRAETEQEKLSSHRKPQELRVDTDDFDPSWDGAAAVLAARGGFGKAARGDWWRWLLAEARASFGVTGVEPADYARLRKEHAAIMAAGAAAAAAAGEGGGGGSGGGAGGGAGDGEDTGGGHPLYEVTRRNTDIVDKDIPRMHCFEDEVHACKYATIQAQARRILLAYAVRNPAVGYCQGMDRICALFLVTMGSEEDAFAAFVFVIECVLINYHDRTLGGARRAAEMFELVLEDRVPEVLEKISSLPGSEAILPLLTTKWFITGFIDEVNSATAMRIWDLILVNARSGWEACRVPIAVAVAVFRLAADDFCREGTDDMQGMYRIMKNEIEMRLRGEQRSFQDALREELDAMPSLESLGGEEKGEEEKGGKAKAGKGGSEKKG